MSLKTLASTTALGASIALLIIMGVQYPLATTFPMGPDAPAHVRDALKLTKEYPGDSSGIAILLQSPYPLSIVLFNFTRILPLSWADRFSWWMAVGHIAVGLSLGLLLYRLHSWQAAAIAISIWAPLTTVFNNHIVSGTLSQLWSLVFLLLFFERLAAHSIMGTTTMFILTVVAHPLTAMILLLTLVTALPAHWIYRQQLTPQERLVIKTLTIPAGLCLTAVLYKIVRGSYITTFWSGPHLEFGSALLIPIVPWLLLSIPAWIIIQQELRSQKIFLAFFNTCALLTFFLAINERFGVDIWTYRFKSTLAVMVIVALSLGLLRLVRLTLSSPLAQTAFIGLLLVGVAAPSWDSNTSIYAYYEDKTKYHRIDTDEIKAMMWMNNLPSNAYILSTNVNRHSEWIPIYSHRRYEETTRDSMFFEPTKEQFRQVIESTTFTHVVIFLRREQVPESFKEHPETFVPVYNNNGAIIFAIRK